MKIVVLGTSGMLGGMVARVFADRGFDVTGTVRSGAPAGGGRPSPIRLATLDAEAADEAALAPVIDGAGWIINAIGVIKPYIRDGVAADVERALQINALFPHRLACAAARTGASVLQIATDCVYAGTTGGYLEGSSHDALDVYGKTKSLGEVRGAHVHHLRTSIVGPERGRRTSLLEWFRHQPHGATIAGFTTHRWNGVTTLQFARACAGIVERGIAMPDLHHLIPADAVTKHELLGIFARAFGREDLTIAATAAAPAIDRTLRTADPALDRALWTAAGYDRPPTIAAMIDELAALEREPASAWPEAS